MTEEANEVAVNYANNETQQATTKRSGRRCGAKNRANDTLTSSRWAQFAVERRAPAREMMRWDGIVGHRWTTLISRTSPSQNLGINSA